LWLSDRNTVGIVAGLVPAPSIGKKPEGIFKRNPGDRETISWICGDECHTRCEICTSKKKTFIAGFLI
jgi:hypothetical protein